METFKALTSRKSVRTYTKTAVDRDAVEKIVLAGQKAPNAGPFHITVITDADLLKEINDTTLTAMKNSGNEFLMSRAELDGYQPLYGAPVLILLSAPDEGYGKVNTACVATYMTIAATALGLGSCYVVSPVFGLNATKEILKKLNLPDNYVPMCGVLVGHAGEDIYTNMHQETGSVDYID